VDADRRRFSLRNTTLLPQSARHSSPSTQLEKAPRPVYRFSGGAAVSLA
jgi:hypothetical protein